MSANGQLTETIRIWNAAAGAWDTVRVPVTEPKRTRPCQHAARIVRHRDLSDVPTQAPIPAWWRYTAYGNPGDLLADTRTYVKAPAVRTHRAAVVMPADPGRVTELDRNANPEYSW